MFSYEAAFQRNRGWVTSAEQSALRRCRVAIAGMGGVGGVHLETLARLGVGQFHLADLDRFEIANFNRQAGAKVSSLGQPKVHVMAGIAQDINPEAEIEVFDSGVSLHNLDHFLSGVDLYLDGLDFFAFDIRAAVFARCRELGIPAVTAAPLGMGTALLSFMPTGMSFERYFGWSGQDDEARALRFMIGLSPRMLQDYLVDPSALDLAGKRGPSTPMACQLCAGVAATEVLKILLKRPGVRAAPWGLHFDAYRGKLVRTWRPWGARNPLQRLMVSFGARRLAALRAASAASAGRPG